MAEGVDAAVRLKLEDLMSSGLQRVKGELKGLGDSTRSAGQDAERSGGMFGGFMGGLAKLGLAAGGIAAVTGAFKGLTGGLIAGNAEFERYEVQFGVLLGSVDKAKERIGELSKFAATTPFELPEVVRAGKVLESFGLQGEKAIARIGKTGPEVLRTIGDAAAGSGAKFDELALTFGKFASGATGEALMRMQELGLTTKEELAKMGVAFDKSGSLLTDKDKALGIVMQAVNARFGGMMEKQSQTFEGMTSNLSDWIGQTRRKLAAPIFEVVKDKLGGLLEFLNAPATTAALEGFATKLAGGIKAAMDAFGTVASVVSGAVALIKDALTGDVGLAIDSANEMWFGFFGTGAPREVLRMVEIVTGALTALVDTIKALFAGDFATAFKTGVEGWSNFREDVITMVVDALPRLLAALNGWAQAATAWITEKALPELRAALPGIATHMLEFVRTTADKLVTALTGFARAFFEWVVPAIPPLLEQLLGLVGTMLRWIGDHSEEIGAKLAEWAGKFAEVIFTVAIPELLKALPGILWTVAKWVATEGIPGIIKVALGLGKGILTGVLNGIEEMQEALFTHLGNLGGDIVAGLRNGISGAWDDLMARVRGLIMQIPEGIRNLLGISSPSKVTAALGYEIVAGLAQGIAQGAPEVEDLMSGLVGRLMSKADAAIARSQSAMVAIAQGLPGGRYSSPYEGLSGFDRATGKVRLAPNDPDAARLLATRPNEYMMTTQLVVDGKVLAQVVSDHTMNGAIAKGASL